MNEDVRYVWLDLETSGFNPRVDEILEVGVVVTKADLTEIARYSSPLGVHAMNIAHMADVVREMHTKSGLLDECYALHAREPFHASRVLNEVDRFIAKFTEGSSKSNVYLAGSSVHFDRSFLDHQYPRIIQRMSHRVLDVSVYRVLMDSWGYKLGRKKMAHRAIPDIEESIELFREFVSVIDLKNPVG